MSGSSRIVVSENSIEVLIVQRIGRSRRFAIDPRSFLTTLVCWCLLLLNTIPIDQLFWSSLLTEYHGKHRNGMEHPAIEAHSGHDYSVLIPPICKGSTAMKLKRICIWAAFDPWGGFLIHIVKVETTFHTIGKMAELVQGVRLRSTLTSNSWSPQGGVGSNPTLVISFCFCFIYRLLPIIFAGPNIFYSLALLANEGEQ